MSRSYVDRFNCESNSDMVSWKRSDAFQLLLIMHYWPSLFRRSVSMLVELSDDSVKNDMYVTGALNEKSSHSKSTFAVGGQSVVYPAVNGTIDLHSSEGVYLARKQNDTSPMWILLQVLELQQNVAYCGIAAIVTILNALMITQGLPAPVPAILRADPRNTYYTQVNVFINDCVGEVPTHTGDDKISAAFVASLEGSTLAELEGMTNCWAQATATHASDGDEKSFRIQASTALSQGRFVAVNYLRSALGQVGLGHYTVLGAYDEDRDCFLMLEVAKFKYPSVWVRTNRLFEAMNTTDPDTQASRGWVIVSKPETLRRIPVAGGSHWKEEDVKRRIKQCLERWKKSKYADLICHDDPEEVFAFSAACEFVPSHLSTLLVILVWLFR